MTKKQIQKEKEFLVKLGCSVMKNGKYRQVRPITEIDLHKMAKAGLPIVLKFDIIVGPK